MRSVVLAMVMVCAAVCAARASDGEGRVLRHSVVVSAPAAEVWEALTTAEGWVRGFGLAKAEVDLRVGGAIRTHYDPAGELDDPNTIVNTILSYEPGRMLSMKATAPANAPPEVKLICEAGWSVVTLEPLGATRTRVSIAGMGYGEGELYDKAYAFFDRRNAWSLQKFRASFEDESDEHGLREAGALLRKLAGEWEFAVARPDGGAFRGRTSVRELFGGKLLVATGYLGDKNGLFHHSHYLAARDPRSGSMKVWNFSEQGDYTEGEARAEDGKLVLDWHTHAAGDGSFQPYRVEHTFEDDDAFRCEIYRPGAGGEMERFVDVRYTRCPPGTEPMAVDGNDPRAKEPYAAAD